MEGIQFILATEIPKVSDIPEWINALWTWVLTDWLWILRAFVEIGALAIVLFYIFTYLQRSRGWPVVLGFLLVIAGTFFIAILKLEVLSWLLQQVFLFTTVAILIIFQPELRRLLAELGNLPLFTTDGSSQLDIDVIVQATDRLSRKKVGGIMAIEQSVDIHQETQSGVFIDSVVTPEMLESIFFPNSTLHDGGVVIHGDRIMHASVIFPLTRRIDVNHTLGTRHRAAIGLSEETDAIVIIVSEETGDISYCFDGTLHSRVSTARLKEFLSEKLLAESSPEEEPGAFVRLRATLRDLAEIINSRLRAKEEKGN